MEIYLSRITSGTLYMSGCNSYAEMKAAKLANIGWSGEPGKVKEYMAARWVRSVEGRYRDYHRPEEYTGGFSTALQSFATALAVLGNSKFIIIRQK